MKGEKMDNVMIVRIVSWVLAAVVLGVIVIRRKHKAIE